MTGFNLNIAADPTFRWPALRAHCGRVTIILGANGTGKSNLLMQMRVKKVLPGRTCCPVEGGRVLKPPETTNKSTKNFGMYRNAATSREYWKSHPTLADRIESTFMLLAAEDSEAGNVHSAAVTEWKANGSVGPCPDRQESKLERLFQLFNDLFPDVTMAVSGGAIHCEKHGNKYPPSRLSDGERQVLGLLADVLFAAPSDSFVIVDEPELNLHTQLAIDLWSLIERELPDALFIYATHNIQFAARQSVDSVIVLGGRDGGHVLVDSAWDIPPEILPAFLGSASTILRAKHALLTEGTDRSFDVPFYQWLVSDNAQLVLPIGGCGDVLGSVAHQEPWNRLVSGTKISGVIDRDYRHRDELQPYSEKGCVVLALHEAESYLCHPDVIRDFTARLGLEDPPAVGDVEAIIRDFAESSRLGVIGRRTANRLGIRLGPSISRAEMRSVVTENELMEMLNEGAVAELRKASERLDDSALRRILQEELDQFREALAGDVIGLLALIPGKELLHAHLLPITGCPWFRFLHGVQHHLRPTDYAHTAKLANELVALRT